MNTLFDQYGNLNTDDLIAESPSFQKIMADGIVTEEEINEQSQRVISILHKLDDMCNDEQIDLIRELLAEVSVLVAVRNLNNNK